MHEAASKLTRIHTEAHCTETIMDQRSWDNPPSSGISPTEVEDRLDQAIVRYISPSLHTIVSRHHWPVLTEGHRETASRLTEKQPPIWSFLHSHSLPSVSFFARPARPHRPCLVTGFPRFAQKILKPPAGARNGGTLIRTLRPLRVRSVLR